MKKFFFWCEVVLADAATAGSPEGGVFDVVADSEWSAELAIRDQLHADGLELVSLQFLYARCESITEFIRKAAA